MESFATPIRGSERARKPKKSPSSWKKNIKKPAGIFVIF